MKREITDHKMKALWETNFFNDVFACLWLEPRRLHNQYNRLIHHFKGVLLSDRPDMVFRLGTGKAYNGKACIVFMFDGWDAANKYAKELAGMNLTLEDWSD